VSTHFFREQSAQVNDPNNAFSKMDSSPAPRPSSLALKPDPNPSFTKTIRHLPYTYFHLTLLGGTNAPQGAIQDIDAITARKFLNTALNQFLGITGTAIPIDILQTKGRDVFIRVPGEDGPAVLQALTSWTGESVAWSVNGKGGWLGAVVAGNGRELFED
jgi:ribonuclease P/MRP protein subunit POP8